MKTIETKKNIRNFADCPLLLRVNVDDQNVVRVTGEDFLNQRSETELLRVFPDHMDLIGLSGRQANGQPMFHGRANSRYYAEAENAESLGAIMRDDGSAIIERFKASGNWDAIYDEHAKRWAAAILDRYGVDQGSSDSASA